MRFVKRTEKPRSLLLYGEQWTRELLEQIEEKGSYAKVEAEYKDRYRQEDVKKSLEKMYTGHCCYCESVIGLNTYGRIEHLKPKSLVEFHRYIFDWSNLHWCCEVCNTSYKKAKWNFEYPILDPSSDNIKEYLQMNLQTGEYEEINGSLRAKTTIEDAGLNREKLIKARRRIIIRIVKDFRAHSNCGDEQAFLSELRELMEDMSFPSLYDELITYLSATTE